MSEAKHPAVIFSVRFKSKLPPEEVERRYKERLPAFREVPGLLQKYYVQGQSPNEWGGIYLWDSQESLDAYMASELRKTIADTYEFAEPPQIDTITVVDVLRP